MSKRKHTVIIGGGITGLAAAYYLKKDNPAMDITLVEATNELGGKMKTVQKEGFTIERGPDSFLERKQSAKELVVDLGLEDELVRNATGQSYILSHDKLHPIPKGAVMGIPTDLGPFVTSSLFSWGGKLAALKDLFVAKSNNTEDVSVGHFFRRRLGNQVVDRLIHPLISGIYSGDIDQLSLKATFPHFQDIEQKHRSLMRGLMLSKTKQPKTISKPQGQFLTLKNGLQKIVSTLESELEKNITILKETTVKHIEKDNGHYNIYFENHDDKVEADYVIMTTPHEATRKIFSQYDFIHHLLTEKNTSVANVVLAFEKDAVEQLPTGTGFVVSRKDRYRITACTWTHKKWPHTTPEGHVLMRAYVGKPGDEEILDLTDQEIETIVLNELKTILPIQKPPLFSIVTKWNDAMPQYTVGHVERLEVMESKLKEHLPNVYLAGNSYRGVGIPDCIDQAKSVVKKIVNR
ncbi:protoporphyrinogen oxidase [Bacillaceae bacterium W0354]